MKAVIVVLAVVVLVAAIPACCMQKGTFQYGDYTISVVPYDPSHPGHGGSFTITCSTDIAIVNITGEYITTTRPKPVLSVFAAGTIETPDGVYDVEKSWVFVPRDTHNVWRVVVGWIESEIAS